MLGSFDIPLTGAFPDTKFEIKGANFYHLLSLLPELTTSLLDWYPVDFFTFFEVKAIIIRL
jgi:hypothetical protein